MLIDCDSCAVRDIACSDCVVTALLAMPPTSAPVELDDAERTAIAVLADSGLVPPLRLLARSDEPATRRTYDGGHAGGAARVG